MLIKKEILISADISKVWKIFSQLENWPKWSGCILKAKWISEDEWKKDSLFAQTAKGFGFIKQFKSDVRIVEIKPYKKVKWTGTRKLINGTHAFEFIKIDGKTKVINHEYFKGLLAPVLFPLFKNDFELHFEQFLNGLKKEAEK